MGKDRDHIEAISPGQSTSQSTKTEAYSVELSLQTAEEKQ